MSFYRLGRQKERKAIMAKKQSASAEAKPKEGQTSPVAADQEAPKKAPKKAKEPKAKPAPAAAVEGTPPKAAEVETVPVAATAPAAAPVSGETKRRGRQPGHPPSPGKKLKLNLRNVRERLAKEAPFPARRAVTLLKQWKRAKFDETVEVHMSLGIDTTQNDQMVRGSVPLPHGIGKSVRVLVFCQGDNIAKAEQAGADHAGGTDLIKKIQEGWLDFDVALATQDMMGMVSRLGKVLGPRGLMPTPKAGTVITAGSDVAAAVKEFKAGKVEYRADKGGNVHAGIGKLSFDEEKLVANLTAFVEQVRAAKPSAVKGNFVKSITLSATMSPGIPITV
jgi:large subunit ribosomal protein L1